MQFPYDVRLRNLLSTLIICTMVVHQALCKFQTVIHGTEYNFMISNLESKTDKLWGDYNMKNANAHGYYKN